MASPDVIPKRHPGSGKAEDRDPVAAVGCEGQCRCGTKPFEGYWIPAFAGMTRSVVPAPSCPHSPPSAGRNRWSGVLPPLPTGVTPDAAKRRSGAQSTCPRTRETLQGPALCRGGQWSPGRGPLALARVDVREEASPDVIPKCHPGSGKTGDRDPVATTKRGRHRRSGTKPFGGYWIPAFAGMTRSVAPAPSCPHSPPSAGRNRWSGALPRLPTGVTPDAAKRRSGAQSTCPRTRETLQGPALCRGGQWAPGRGPFALARGDVREGRDRRDGAPR